MKSRLKIGIIFSFLWLAACSNRNIVVEQTVNFEKNEWSANKPATFEFEIEDTVSFFNLFLKTENTNDYPNSNIWFFTQLNSPQAYTITDTLEYSLCNAKGQWYGNKSGDGYAIWNLYKQNVKFRNKGKYLLTVTQGMRTNNLQGIKSVSLIIQKLERKGK